MTPQSDDSPEPGDTPTVTAHGDGVVRVAPDEADLWIALTSLAPTPAAALADVTQRSETLTALFDELAIDRADRSLGGVSMHEEHEHSAEGRRSLGHRASVNAAVRATDPAIIGQLITQATERARGQVSGPHWQVSPANPARLEAARLASADARRRAEAFARGLDARLGRVVSVVETKVAPQPARLSALRTQAVRGPAGHEPGAVIEPGEHEVVSSVVVSFALEQA